MGTPLSVRLTAINGYQVTTRIPEIKNDFDFPSKVQFKGIKRGREQIFGKKLLIKLR